MDSSWLSEASKQCSAKETVIVAIRSQRHRRQIADGFRHLGDSVLDWYGVSRGQPFASLFQIPHRLIVMGYRDYKDHRNEIAAYLSTSDSPVPPLLIYGRMWRKLPTHHSIIDGDRISGDELCRMYWEARGGIYLPADAGGSI